MHGVCVCEGGGTSTDTRGSFRIATAPQARQMTNTAASKINTLRTVACDHKESLQWKLLLPYLEGSDDCAQ